MNANEPSVRWDSQSRTFDVTLPVENDRVIDAKIQLPQSFVVRIREKGVDEWSPGYDTPFNQFTFVGLKPDTAYEIQVTARNDAGEGSPAFHEARTLADGTLGDISV